MYTALLDASLHLYTRLCPFVGLLVSQLTHYEKARESYIFSLGYATLELAVLVSHVTSHFCFSLLPTRLWLGGSVYSLVCLKRGTYSVKVAYI